MAIKKNIPLKLKEAGLNFKYVTNNYYIYTQNIYQACIFSMDNVNPYPHLGIRVIDETLAQILQKTFPDHDIILVDNLYVPDEIKK